MIGAIAGDIIGSKYEFHRTKEYGFELFKEASTYTDDTVLTVATAEALMSGEPYPNVYHRYYSMFSNRGFGGMFKKWAASGSREGYNSLGNGSAMRVSPCGWAFDDEASVLSAARDSASATHNHPEGIKGAEAVAWCIWAARKGMTKAAIREGVTARWAYNLGRTLDEIRPGYKFDATCPGSVPESILCFLESKDYEDTVRLAVSLGGDADTMACISGSISEAFYGGVPEDIARKAFGKLDNRLKTVVAEFSRRHVNKAFDLDVYCTETKNDLVGLMGTIFSS